jgi:hypothetical protein
VEFHIRFRGRGEEEEWAQHPYFRFFKVKIKVQAPLWAMPTPLQLPVKNDCSCNIIAPTCLQIVYRQTFNFTIYPPITLLLFRPAFPSFLHRLFHIVSDLPLPLFTLCRSSPHIYVVTIFSLVSFLPPAYFCLSPLTSRYAELDLAKRKQFVSL